MNLAPSRHGPAAVFTAPDRQRMIVVEAAGRWLGLLRASLSGGEGAATPAETAQALRRHDCPGRGVIPALNLRDAAAMAREFDRTLVLIEFERESCAREAAAVSTLDWPPSTLLVASVANCGHGEKLLLLEAGFAAVLPAFAGNERLIRLAAEHFSGQYPGKSPWPESLVNRLPWARFGSEVDWDKVLP